MASDGCSADGGLLLIPHPSLSIEPEMVAEAVRRGHRVLLSSSQAPREQVPTLRLPRAYRHDLEKALKVVWARRGESKQARAKREEA